MHLGLEIEERLKRAGGLLEHGSPGVCQPILRQISDRQGRRSDDPAGVRLVKSGEHFEERGLAGAVRSAETDTIPVADLPGDAIEQYAIAKRLGELRKLNQSNRRNALCGGNSERLGGGGKQTRARGTAFSSSPPRRD